mgnify:CR=1 FL=1
MNRLLVVFAAALCLIGSASAANPVVINVDDASPPFAYSAGGNVIGVYPTLFYTAFAKMGIPVKLVAKPWNQSLAEADAGKAAIGYFFATPERLTRYDFSEPVFTENIAVYYNKAKPINFKNIRDLYGKKIGVVRNRHYGEDFAAAKKNGGITTIESFNDKMNFRNLNGGLGDAVLATEESGKAILFSEKLLGVEQGKEYLISNKGHLAFVKSANQTELLEKFNKTIAAMKQDGSLDKIVKQELTR